jgi:hypothetical protein
MISFEVVPRTIESSTRRTFFPLNSKSIAESFVVNGFFSDGLSGHYKGSADISVFNKPFSILKVELVCQLHSACTRTFWNGDDHIGIKIGGNVFYFFGEILSHSQSGFIH